MTARSYLTALVAAIVDMHKAGDTSMTWQEIVEHLRAPNPPSQAEVSAVLGNSGDRRTVCDMLIEGGLLAVQTNDRYTTDFLRSTYAPARLTPTFVRQFLGLFGAGAGTGIRICTDSTDPFWIAKQLDEASKFGSGVRRRNDLATDMADRDGNVDGAREVIATGMAAAYPQATSEQIKISLGTTVPRLMSDTLKKKP